MTQYSTWHNDIYGELFSDKECAELFSTQKQFTQLLTVEAAWTRAIGLGNTANKESANKVAKKILAIDITIEPLRQGVYQDGIAIPALVRLIKQQLSAEEQRYFHQGLTSQDVIDTALIITLREFRLLLNQRLSSLQQAFKSLQQQFSQNTFMAYTRMQAALPTTASHVIEQWQRPITTLIDELNASKKYLDCIQYGGPIGDRGQQKKDYDPNIAQYFADQLDLQDPGYAWHTNRSNLIKLAQCLCQLCQATGKIGTDVALMAALGEEQIVLAKGGGSSAMAHKNNPIQAEALSTLASMAAMQLNGIQSSAVHEHFRSGKSWAMEFLVLPELCITTAAAIRIAKSLIDNIENLGSPKQ